MFPARGWTDRFDVPKSLVGSTILFVGSQPDTAELVVDYVTKAGRKMRLVLEFTELGMWPKNALRRHVAKLGASKSRSRKVLS